MVRSEKAIDDAIRRKISLFCDVDFEAVIACPNARDIYQVPLILHEQGFDEVIVEALHLEPTEPDLSDWTRMVERALSATDEVTIGVVGKYVDLPDAYLSVVEALRHGALANDVRLDLRWIPSDDVDGLFAEGHLEGLHGILVPGGFGVRGVEGKIRAIRHARERDIPFLGLCLGLQCAVIEFARNVIGLTGAHSAEFDPTAEHRVIDLMESQVDVADMGGTMRLGIYAAKLAEESLVRRLYGQELVYERHRHRFEVNNKYRPDLEQNGMSLSGISPDEQLVEYIELPQHPYFIATQAHPELKSRPTDPHPLFAGFMAAADEYRRNQIVPLDMSLLESDVDSASSEQADSI